MKTTPSGIICLAVIVLLAGASAVRADGKFIPPEVVVHDPEVPRQQALAT